MAESGKIEHALATARKEQFQGRYVGRNSIVVVGAKPQAFFTIILNNAAKVRNIFLKGGTLQKDLLQARAKFIERQASSPAVNLSKALDKVRKIGQGSVSARYGLQVAVSPVAVLAHHKPRARTTREHALAPGYGYGEALLPPGAAYDRSVGGRKRFGRFACQACAPPGYGGQVHRVGDMYVRLRVMPAWG